MANLYLKIGINPIIKSSIMPYIYFPALIFYYVFLTSSPFLLNKKEIHSFPYSFILGRKPWNRGQSNPPPSPQGISRCSQDAELSFPLLSQDAASTK